jgi:hypothetical protein
MLWGVALTTHPHLVPKSRAIPLLPLWAFMACSRRELHQTMLHEVFFLVTALQS